VSERTGAAGTYDASADAYPEALAINAGAAARLVATLPAGRYARVLDLGCGTGFAALAATRALAPEEVVGVDVSEGMLARCRERLDGEAPRTRALLGRADAIPVANGWADLVVATMVLQWVDDRPAALAEIARVLAPAGRVALLVPARGSDREFHTVLRSLDPPPPPAWLGVEKDRTIDPGALAQMLEHAGLAPGDWWIEERRRRIAPADLVRRMRLVGEHAFPEGADEPLAATWSRLEVALVGAAGAHGFGSTFRKLFLIAARSPSPPPAAPPG